MDLYFMPFACSLATRIALYEAGAEARFVEVDKTKRTPDGEDFHQINPLGLVPTLRLDDGSVLTENQAILQYVTRRFPEALHAPRDEQGWMRLQEWLGFVGTELHSGLFNLLLAPDAPDAVKAYARAKGLARFDVLETRLRDREYLVDGFSVADAYLVVVLNWTSVTDIDLANWPAVNAYVRRMRARPAFARAMTEERALYQRAQK